MKEANRNTKVCRYCGKEITGRPDKMFCNEKCRNAYHNPLKNKSCEVQGRTITALKMNYRILSSLIRSGRKSAELSELEQIGFRPYYMTAIIKGRQKHDEFVCFDITYRQTGTRVSQIRRNSLLDLDFWLRGLVGVSGSVLTLPVDLGGDQSLL